MSNLRWKIVTVFSVLVIFAAVGVYPIAASLVGVQWPSWLMAKQLKLGLDLKGGVHLKAEDGTPMANVMLTLMQSLGMDVKTFGDSTAPFSLA